MGKIRWLHISDLHYDREMMGDWPAGQNGFPVTGIDFIVFTGDMHTYGRDYNEGKRFLTELAKHYNLNPSEDIFIVPGNHDVDPYRVSTKGISAVKLERGRRAAERNAKKATQVVSKSFDDFAIDRLKHLRNAPSDVLNADGSHLSHRFSEYCEAVESICGPAPFSRDRDPFAYAGAFCRKWKNRINLIHVNSALLSCSDTYRAQILDICAINDLSYNPAFNRALPTIILAHHNYAELAAIQREALKPILAGLNVRAYLNGDCHQRGEDNILLDGGRAIPCFTAPSIYKAQGDDAASIGFYLYEMDTDSPQWRVNVTSYRWIEWRWEIAPCRAIPVFNMRDISAGLHERYARDVKKLSLDILPGITYQSPDGTVTNEYKNRGDTAPSPMLQLLEEHRDVRHFQLVGKGGSSCGGVGKTSTLLNLAFSLTSSSNAPDIAPLYIQLRRIYGINSKSKNNENRILHYMREEYKLTEADRNASFIFLLDGFNEIPTTTMQIRCLRDILDISDKKYPEAAIILSNRDPLDTYMDLLEYENGFDADQIDRLKFYFHNCYIKELSQEQIDDYFEPNQRCLVPAARNILDTPFYLVLYRQAMQPSGKDAGRWITDAFQDHLNNGTPEKTTLMLQMLLREIDNLRSDITSAERELRCFILTKVLPYLGYQMALSSHLDPALTPIKSPNFFRRDAYARTYACLSAYLPTIDIWNEYKNQNPETLEKPWNTLRKLYQDSNPDISDLTAAIPYTVFPSGLLCHHGRNISFCHDNYRDVSAANQNNQNYQEIARLGYVSKAYLVLAAIGTSGGALNLLAQMLINQANQYEADQRISFFRRHPDIDTFVQQHAAPYGWPLNDNYALAYRVLQSVCGIQRGSQPYSHMKKAELVLKGYVSESSSTQLTSLNIAINGGLAMGHYWKGRLLLEQAKQDHDRCNDYKDAAIASFCATNVTERFDHLPENADEDAAPQLSPPQWLSAIELLRYPDRAVFRVDRRMVFQTIYQKLTQQVEEVQSDNIQIHNERYRLTKKDVRSNLERCLDMVKAQFPDKEPLIQKMIRSIR